ncbi:VC_2705 family sodium/solute symporter [Hydrogenophaga sp. PBL-H3]|uniref:VC_2705 family sodium/solute symporter n=1 Tax=Hydrogenophaga sp. PBL-H3 TaxID=434010 RepID=UPI00131FC255|nr:VC_2705 family sodium/solute symporter [Hydrogenophaga sp. PBL-H3]QHE76231.1 cation acetate symporter [Hydrogenophaga sp. PBL-H3]QHE80655.1 cation acetate symporter [Hydrogenophaga sp. PBL-H3]
MAELPAYAAYKRRLHRILTLYILALIAFLLLMAWAERSGLSRSWLGPIFLFSTVMMYGGIGIYGRTVDPEEYYVAGRRIPPVYNGMAAAADWMSAASFISLAGGLYLQGFGGTEGQVGGLAYVMGWTGGFCLVALLIAPHLRRLNLYTVPDYFKLRYGGNWPRRIAAFSAVLCSFTYVVAQIYGIGLVASRLTGVQFEIGIMLGLGGVVLCSFLGGMRAITWTQVAQYIILLLAFLIPVSWLAYKQVGNPLAPLVYGKQIEKITKLEHELMASPSEQQVQAEFLRRANQYAVWLQDVEGTLTRERALAEEHVRTLKAQNAPQQLVNAAGRQLSALPKDVATARERWTQAMKESQERSRPLGGLLPHSQAFAGDPDGTPAQQQAFQSSRANFLALMFCLMLGTAGLPHLLTRYFTTPSVATARASVAWTLFFIALLYLSAPALAVLVKFEVMQNVVGSSFDALPAWIAQWARLDSSLVSVSDVNGDGILQFGEIRLGADVIMLATPELGGMPYVVSGLVAAGGLAAALSTADGLLLTISNSLVRDTYCSEVKRVVPPEQRVILSKFVLLSVATVAAFVAAYKPAEILPLVASSFSLAASALVPAMIMGIFWSRTTGAAAVAGMLLGLGLTVAYMMVNAPLVRAWVGLAPGQNLWFSIQPVSAGVFGVPLGFAVIIAVSCLWRRSPSLP